MDVKTATSWAPRWICRCGASNHPLRIACEHCGAELRMVKPTEPAVPPASSS